MMGKRLFDLIASAVGLLLLAVPMAIVAIVIKVDSPGPVFFRQRRVGRGGRTFRIYKFRTMSIQPNAGSLLTVGEDPRITRIGRRLRKWKIDEFPQLINVVLGDMSLVGPRPEVPEYAFLYPEQERVWSVRPGITDPTSLRLLDESGLLAGVADPEAYYRDVLLPKKIEAYLEYIDHMSLRYDVGVVFDTLRTLYGASRGDQ